MCETCLYYISGECQHEEGCQTVMYECYESEEEIADQK
jgi:hypothetical protein